MQNTFFEQDWENVHISDILPSQLEILHVRNVSQLQLLKFLIIPSLSGQIY